MKTIDLKEEVRRAVESQWPAFAEAHPNLARVIEQSLVVEEAAAQLADDPQYQEAMAGAQAAGLGADALAGLIRGLVTDWLNRLF